MRKILCCLLLLWSVVAFAADTALRPLWMRVETPQYLNAWYICGPFFADRFAMDLERVHALVWGNRGEHRPMDGAEELRADGALLRWKAALLDEDGTVDKGIDLHAVLGVKLPDHALVYAYTILPRSQAGSAYLALDRNTGISVWVNGAPLLTEKSPRLPGGTPVLPVEFRQGDNIILLKLDCPANNRYFNLRVLQPDQVFLAANARSPREFATAVETDGSTLIVRTGDTLTGQQEVRRAVTIRITGAGGRLAAGSQVPYGETATFDTAEWLEGAYDITCRLVIPPNTPGIKADSPPVISHALWYKGDAMVAARQLVGTAPDSSSDAPVDLAHTLLAGVVRERLGNDLTNTGGLPSVLAPLMEWEEICLQAKEPARPSSLFFNRLAYRDDIDGVPQFARLYLPPDYQPSRRYPLIVVLHGMNRENPPYTQWGGFTQRYDGIADRCHAIVLHPFGRANAWYRGLGEADVLRCIQLAKDRFTIDPDRVYLMGYSMGGAGVWHVGSAHPEVFAALAPWYGGLEPSVTTPKAVLDAFTPRQQRNIARFSTFAQVESLLTTPVFVSHGDQDKMVPIEITRYGVSILHNWGYPVYLWEQPGKGHGGIDTEDKVLPWLLSQRRTARPAHVRLRAACLSMASAHWVQVLQREKPDAFVQADAQVIAPNLIRLETENALSVRLQIAQAPVDPQKPLRVIWNGKESIPVADDRGVVLYAPGYTPSPSEKAAAVEGPIGDIFNTPFAIVIGTISPDLEMRAYCLRYAQREIAWWKAFQQTTPRIILDTRLTEEDCARYSLLLIGGPEENLIAQQFAGQLPLTITPAGFSIDAKFFPVRDGGVRMIYPHPQNPARYLVIAAANSAAGMYRLAPFNNRYDVDYAVTDGRPGRELAAGLFDRNWRTTDALLERHTPKGDLPGVPRMLSAAIPANQLYLSDLAEDRVEGDVDYLTGTVNTPLRPARLGRKRFTHSLCMNYFTNAKAAFEYTLTGGDWQHFRATIGLPEPLKSGKVIFVLRGDGMELYRSPTFTGESRHARIDIPIRDVNTLRLEMEFTGNINTTTACWGDARVEK